MFHVFLPPFPGLPNLLHVQLSGKMMITIPQLIAHLQDQADALTVKELLIREDANQLVQQAINLHVNPGRLTEGIEGVASKKETKTRVLLRKSTRQERSFVI